MRYLRTNTATIVTVGPFLDKTDGVTLETGLTITNERITLTVDANDGSAPTLVLDNVTGATSGTSNDLNYITNNDAGLMQLELAAANVNYLGRAFLTITDAANHCPVFHEFTILPAQVYDSIIAGTDLLDANASQLGGTTQTGRDIGASVLLSSGTGTGQLSITSGVVDANATQISGDSTAADNAESFFDGTGYAGTNNVIPTVTTLTGHTAQTGDAYAVVAHADYGNAKLVRSTTPANTLTVDASHQALALTNAITNDAITAAAIANGAIDAATFAAGAITAAAIATGAIDADAIADNAIDAGAIAADAITAAKIAADVTTEIQSGLATAAELAKVPKSDGSASWNATALAAIQQEATDALNAYDPPTNAEMEARTLVAASYFDPAADTVAHVTLVDTTTTNTDMITAATIADAVWDEASAGHTDAGKAGQQLWTDIDAILVDTTEIGVAGAGLTAIDLPDQTMNITGNITGNLSGSVGSVTGAVGSVTGNVGGNVTGSVGSVAAGGITAASIATGAIDADALAADAVTEIQSGLATAAALDAVDNYIDTEIGAIKAVTDKLDTALELDGAVYRYTTNALEQAPTGGSAPTVEQIRQEIDANSTKLADILTDTGTTLDGLIKDIPTVAEFEARTLVAAAYFDPATDVVAHVTLVDTTTTNTDMVTVGDVADAVWDEALAGHAGAGTAGATLSAASAPTVGEVADAVWDEAIAGHLGAGTTGAALNAAGAAGDPWTTALPGAYADGTAGDIIGNLVTDIGALTPAVAISATTAASVSSGALAIRTHHSLSQAISSTYSGDLSAATKLWLAVKAEKDDTDAQAVIFIEKTAGLTVLAGAAYTTVAHGSLTIGGLAGAWTVTVALDEVATGLLTPYADGMLWAECKALVAGSTVAVWDGVCDIARGIVNAVS